MEKIMKKALLLIALGALQYVSQTITQQIQQLPAPTPDQVAELKADLINYIDTLQLQKLSGQSH